MFVLFYSDESSFFLRSGPFEENFSINLTKLLEKPNKEKLFDVSIN